MELKNKPDFLESEFAQIGSQPAAVVDDIAIEAHPAAARLEDAADDIQQRRLARTTRAKEGHDLAGMHLEAHVAQGIDPGITGAEVFRDVAHVDQRSRVAGRAHR